LEARAVLLCNQRRVGKKPGYVTHGKTGWLTPPANSQKLAEVIQICCGQPDRVAEVVHQASCTALERFKLAAVNLQIYQLLCQIAPV